MDRPSSITRTFCVSLTLGLALIVGACGGSEEEGIITNYFRAARMGDNATLGNIAIVSFDREAGVVQNFTVTNVQEERTALRVREMLEASDAAQAAQTEFSAEMKTFQDENIEVIDRVLQAERADEDVARRDLEVQEAWRTWRDEMSEHTKTVADARSALSDERSIAEISVMRPGEQTTIDVSQYEGELVTKNVTIDAEVRTPDDQVTEKTMMVRMQRAELTDGEETINGRWIITAVGDA